MRQAYATDAYMLLVVLIYGLNFTVVKFAISDFDPLVFGTLRFGVGALILIAFVSLRPSRPIRRRDIPQIAAAAFLGVTINQVALMTAFSLTTASNVALLATTTIPISAAVFGVAFGQERLGRPHWIGLLLGVIGVLLVTSGTAAGGTGGQSFLGDVLSVAAGATWGAHLLLIRPLLERYGAAMMTGVVFGAGVVLLIPFVASGLLGQDYASISAEAWGALIYATLLAVVLTNLLQFTAIRRIGAARTSIYVYLIPFVAVLFAVILLGERIGLLQLAGGGLAVVGLGIARSRTLPLSPTA